MGQEAKYPLIDTVVGSNMCMKAGFLDRHMEAVHNSRQTDSLLIPEIQEQLHRDLLPWPRKMRLHLRMLTTSTGMGRSCTGSRQYRTLSSGRRQRSRDFRVCCPPQGHHRTGVYGQYGKYKSEWEARRGVDEMRFGQLGVSNDIKDPIEGSGQLPGISSVLVENIRHL
jgi:hypothetical protein